MQTWGKRLPPILKLKTEDQEPERGGMAAGSQQAPGASFVNLNLEKLTQTLDLRTSKRASWGQDKPMIPGVEAQVLR